MLPNKQKLITNKKNIIKQSLYLINKIFSSQYFLLITSIIIIVSSLVIRSKLMIGTDAAIYLHLGKKIAEGKKYYYDFFETNLPISFYIYSLEYKISQFLGIDYIIFSDFFINILAILSIYFTAIFARNSILYSDKIAYNLFIINCFAGFFIRSPMLSTIYDFGTKSSFLLILFYPYFALSIINNKNIKKSQLCLRGFLGGLIPCFKPHYLIYIIAIELVQFLYSKNKKFFVFEIDKLIMAMAGLVYINIVVWFIPEYFEMIEIFSELYAKFSIQNFISCLIKNHILFLLLYFIVIGFVIDNKEYKKIYHLILANSLAVIICLSSEVINSIDQCSACFAIIMPPITILLIYAINSRFFYINNFNIYLIIFTIAFSFLSYYLIISTELQLVITLSILFYPLIYILYYKYYQYLKIVIIRLIFQILLLALVVIFIRFCFSNPYIIKNIIKGNILNLLFISIVIYNIPILYSNEKFISQIEKGGYKFSLIINYFIITSLFIIIFTNIKELIKYNDNKYYDIIKIYITKVINEKSPRVNENIMIISSTANFYNYPIINYSHKDNPFKFHSSMNLKHLYRYKLKFDKNNDYFFENNKSKYYDLFFQENYLAAFNKNNKVVFVFYDSCKFNDVANIFNDKEAIKRFFKEYEFYKTVTYIEKNNVVMHQILDINMDIYIRKEDK